MTADGGHIIKFFLMAIIKLRSVFTKLKILPDSNLKAANRLRVYSEIVL